MQLERLFIAGLLTCGVVHPATAQAQEPEPTPATAPVILACPTAVDVELSMPARGATAARKWTFSACARDDENVPANEDASDPPSGSFVAADGRVAVAVSVPAAPEPLRVRGSYAIGARDIDVAGVPGAKITVKPTELSLVKLQVENMKMPELARELVRATGARIDGIEHLSDARVTFRFAAVPLFTALALLADEGKVRVLRGPEEEYAFASAELTARIAAAEAAVDGAGEANDDAALDAALERLVALAPPKPDAPGLDPEAMVEVRAIAASDRADHAAAERLQRRRAAMIERRVGGQTGAAYGLALAEIARLRALQDDASGAAALRERALAIAVEELGPVHPDLAGLQVVLAHVRIGQKQPVAAEELYRNAIRGYEAAGHDVDLDLALALEGLGWVYMLDRRDDRAVPLFERNLALMTKIYGAGDSMATRAGEALADALIGSDQLQRAMPLLERGIAVREDSATRTGLQERLDAIRGLGSYAADGAPRADALASLRSVLARGISEDVRSQMEIMMLRRSVLRHRAAPDGDAWRTACEARTELMLTRSETPPADAAHYRALALRACEDEVAND